MMKINIYEILFERVLPEVKKCPPILLKLCVRIVLYNVCIKVKCFSIMLRYNNDVTILIKQCKMCIYRDI